ncbi:MAG TPA: secondary thiamine-phosphate synthase enzyme YjbQ [bacterium]|nr:secondary thiamine-phosphate synthase enzyme YjbQ [bacterium]
MKIQNFNIAVKTQGFCDIHDLTGEARKKLSQSGIRNGSATLFVQGSTAGLTTVEYEPGLIKDLKELFEKIAPQEQYYHHEETWHDGNGFSHVRASLLKPSLTIPVVEGKMTLGTWQQVVLIDFDNGPRDRNVAFQVMGE